VLEPQHVAEGGTPRGRVEDVLPRDQRAAWAVAAALIALIFFTYLLLRPPLFHHDGYLYRLVALKPFQGRWINPHHLLWYPIEIVLAQVTSRFGFASTEAFQVFGILLQCCSVALFFLLLRRVTNRLVLPVAITIFLAFSPNIWKLGLQNLPNPLLHLFLMLFLWAVAADGTLSHLRLVLGGLALALAVCLHQAAALLVPAVAVAFVLTAGGSIRRRLTLAALWACGTTLTVTAVYAAVAGAVPVKPGHFMDWALGYLRTQHGVEVHLLQSGAKSAIGIVRALLQTSWFESFLDERYEAITIYWVYGAILLLAGSGLAAAVCANQRNRQRFSVLVRGNTLFTSALMMTLTWSVFAFTWEPTGYFWSVNLFPAGILIALWTRESRQRTAWIAAGVLASASLWNLYENHRRDVAYSVSFPPPLLEQIKQQLRPGDLFLVAGREWYADVDYDLLLKCLDFDPPSPAKALLDDYVLPEQDHWQQGLGRKIQTVLQSGSRVFVAGHLFRSGTYQDLDRTENPYSEFGRAQFGGVDGDALADEVRTFFNHYTLTPSGLKLAGDQFWEVKHQVAGQRPSGVATVRGSEMPRP
jgi:hypothetical protein